MILLIPFLALPLGHAWDRWRVTTLVVASVSAFWMIAATVAGPLLPIQDDPTTWLTRLVHQSALSGSVVTGGWAGASLFVVPALAAVALASTAALSRLAARRQPASPGSEEG